MSPCALRKMIQTFETIDIRGILSTGRKEIQSFSVKNVAVEVSSHFLHGSVNMSKVSYVLVTPYSTVLKVLFSIFLQSIQNQSCALIAGQALKGS